jgi:hypothetical protein
MNLKKIIREEIDDMWQNLLQSEPNIWVSYQMLIFNETPTEEEVIKLIRDAFKSGLVKQESIDSWEDEGIENEANIIVDYAERGLLPYLRIDTNGWLYYSVDPTDVINSQPELKTIKYSEVKGHNIKESEEADDFAWVNDIENEIKFKTGDRVRIHNMGDEDAFINWLGSYARNYKNGVYGKNIEGVVLVGEFSLTDKFNIVNITGGHKDDEIYFPYQEKMKNLQKLGLGNNLITDEGFTALALNA